MEWSSLTGALRDSKRRRLCCLQISFWKNFVFGNFFCAHEQLEHRATLFISSDFCIAVSSIAEEVTASQTKNIWKYSLTQFAAIDHSLSHTNIKNKQTQFTTEHTTTTKHNGWEDTLSSAYFPERREQQWQPSFPIQRATQRSRSCVWPVDSLARPGHQCVAVQSRVPLEHRLFGVAHRECDLELIQHPLLRFLAIRYETSRILRHSESLAVVLRVR